MKHLTTILLLLLVGLTATAQNLLNRKAGEQVTSADITRVGIEKCFRAYPIDEAIFARIKGRSYKAECKIPLDELRYLSLLHYTLDGRILRGEILCNRAIADDLLYIFRQLFDAHYPIERMVLVDEYGADDERSMTANNSSAFNYRHIPSGRTLSAHSRGMAIDINPLYNPYVKVRESGTLIAPAAGKPYVDRSRDFPYKLDRNDLCVKLFLARGFEWGGDYKTIKDYQHFEK